MFEEKIGCDEYSDRLRMATITYLKTGPTLGHWSWSWLQLQRIALQYGTDGAARIVHGLTPPNVITTIIQSTKFENAVSLDGHGLKWHDMAVFPAETHFTFVSDHQLSWISFAIPLGPDGEGNMRELDRAISSLRQRSILTLAPSDAERLVATAHAMKAEVNPSVCNAAAAEGKLFETLDSVVTQADDVVPLPSDYNRSAEQLIFKALEFVRARQWDVITVDDLVAVTKVEYRTLLRAFQRYLNVGPKQYLRLRQLDVVRRALRQQDKAEDASVTTTMSAHGVTEFGRFAVEYRRLFHEMPSETFKRSALYPA